MDLSLDCVVPCLEERGRSFGILSGSGRLPWNDGEDLMTSRHAFLTVSGIMFGLAALLHALRLAFRWQVRINRREIPMWVSIGGLVVAAGMCFWAFWLLFK